MQQGSTVDGIPPMPSLRDQFAMAALAGMMGSNGRFGPQYANDNPDRIVRIAYRLADAMMSGRRQKAAVEDTDAADASSPQSSHLLELAYDFAASGIPEVDLSVVCEAWAYLTKEVRDQIVKLARGSEGEVSAYPRLAPEHQVHFDRAVVDDTRLFWVAKAWKGLSESVRGEVLGLVNYSWDRGPE